MIKNNSFLIPKLFNAIAFQAGWVFCVLKGNLFSAIFTITFLLIHLLLLRFYLKYFTLKKEVLWIFAISIMGIIIEAFLFNSGILFSNTTIQNISFIILPPLWIICLWVLFATALRTSLLFLFNNKLLSYLLIIIFVPCSYYAGSHLNTHIRISKPLLLNLSLIALIWACALWAIHHIKKLYFEDIFNVK